MNQLGKDLDSKKNNRKLQVEVLLVQLSFSVVCKMQFKKQKLLIILNQLVILNVYLEYKKLQGKEKMISIWISDGLLNKLKRWKIEMTRVM